MTADLELWVASRIHTSVHGVVPVLGMSECQCRTAGGGG